MARRLCLSASSFLILWLLGAASAALAAPVGQVTHLSGPMFAVKADGTRHVLSIGSQIEAGETLVTEEKTYAQVRFIDKGVVTLKPQTSNPVPGRNVQLRRNDAGEGWRGAWAVEGSFAHDHRPDRQARQSGCLPDEYGDGDDRHPRNRFRRHPVPRRGWLRLPAAGHLCRCLRGASRPRSAAACARRAAAPRAAATADRALGRTVRLPAAARPAAATAGRPRSRPAVPAAAFFPAGSAVCARRWPAGSTAGRLYRALTSAG